MPIIELMEQTDDRDVMELWKPIMEKYFNKLSDEDFCNLYNEIYETIYGEKLSIDKAKTLVDKMKPYGQHWSLEEVKTMTPNIDCPVATKYYVINMLYNDFHDLLEEDTSKYTSMVKLWLEDEDGPIGEVKAYRYATKIAI